MIGTMNEDPLNEQFLRRVDKLRPDLRTVFILRHIEDLSIEEIKDLLKIPASKIDRRLESAIRVLLSQEPSGNLRADLQAVLCRKSPPVDVIEIVEAVKQLTPELILYLKEHEHDLQKIRPDVFEHLVGEFLLQRGFDKVKLVGREAHTSADILAIQKVHAIDSEIRYFVEVKRWKDKVGIQVVNEVYGSMILERPDFGWNAAMIVSLAGFTEQKKTNSLMLSRLNVILKQKEDLLRWLREYQPKEGGLWLPTEHAKRPKV
jgi:HJR/Mrr/RecB family endonuclease